MAEVNSSRDYSSMSEEELVADEMLVSQALALQVDILKELGRDDEAALVGKRVPLATVELTRRREGK